MFEKKVKAPKAGNAKLILNIDGKILEDERPIDDLIVAGKGKMLSAGADEKCCSGTCECGSCHCHDCHDDCGDDIVTLGKNDPLYPAPGATPLFKRCRAVNYEYEDESAPMFEECIILPNNGGGLSAVYPDGGVEKVNRPYMVGDEEKCYGMFVPLAARPTALEFCGNLFLEAANNYRTHQIGSNNQIAMPCNDDEDLPF